MSSKKNTFSEKELKMIEFTRIYLDVIRRGFDRNRHYWYMDKQFGEMELCNDNTKLQEHVHFNPLFPISEEEKDMVTNFLSVISKFEDKEKTCMYCHYVLGMSVSSIFRNDQNYYDEFFYSVSRPKIVIERAIFAFGVSQNFDRLDFSKIEQLKNDMNSADITSKREAMILFSFLQKQ